MFIPHKTQSCIVLLHKLCLLFMLEIGMWPAFCQTAYFEGEFEVIRLSGRPGCSEDKGSQPAELLLREMPDRFVGYLFVSGGEPARFEGASLANLILTYPFNECVSADHKLSLTRRGHSLVGQLQEGPSSHGGVSKCRVLSALRLALIETNGEAADLFEETENQLRGFQWNIKGNEALNEGRVSEALNFFSNAMEEVPEEPVYHANLGAALFRMETWDEALTVMDTALALALQGESSEETVSQLEDKMGQAWNKKGAIAFRNKDYAEAYHCFVEAFANDPAGRIYAANAGSAAKEMGNREDAAHWFQCAVEIAIGTCRYNKIEEYQREIMQLWDTIPKWAMKLVTENERLPDTPEMIEARRAWDGLIEEAFENRETGGSRDPIAPAQKALDLALTHFGETHTKTLLSMTVLASSYHFLGKYALSATLLERSLLRHREAYGTNHPFTLDTMKSLAESYGELGQLSEAEDLFRARVDRLVEVHGENHPDPITAGADLGNFLESRGRYAEAEELFNRSLQQSRKTLGPRHSQTLTHLNQLGYCLSQQGRIKEALPIQDEAFDRRCLVLGPKHPETLISMNNLAGVYESLGMFLKAEALYLECLALRRGALGENHPDTLAVINNIGYMYHSQGMLVEASSRFEEVSGKLTTIYGPNHKNTLTAMNNLAMVYEDQGLLAQAEPIFERIYLFRKERFGDVHPDTLFSMANLAGNRFARGLWKESESLFEEALSLAESALPPLHETRMTLMNNLAEVYKTQAKYDEAAGLLQDVLDLRKNALGNDHPSLLKPMNNLALLFRFLGDFARAEEMVLEALTLSRARLGEKHPLTLLSMNNLAVIYHSQGLEYKARELIITVLQHEKSTLGDRHPDTLQSMVNLAGTYRVEGAYDEAENRYEAALAASREVLGGNHLTTLSFMYNLARLYDEQGLYDRAASLLEKVFAQRCEILGPIHPDTLLTMESLAGVAQSQGRYKEAETLYLQVAFFLGKKFTPHHPKVLEAKSGLAVNYGFQKRYDMAQPLFEEVFDKRKETLGSNHPETLAAMSNLGQVYMSQGLYDKADLLMEEALQSAERVLGDNHPDTLAIRGNLALSYQIQHFFGRAGALWKENLRHGNRFLERILWGANRKTSLAYLQKEEGFYQNYLSFFAEMGEGEELLFFSLTRKGLLFKTSAKIRDVLRDDSDPELQELVTRLYDQRRRLAAMSLAGPGARKALNYFASIRQLEEEIELLEEKLGASVKSAASPIPNILPEDALKALNPDEVLVDFLIYRQPDFEQWSYGDERIIALVVDPASETEIDVVDLGPMEPIASKIKQLRSEIRGLKSGPRIDETARQLYRLMWQPLVGHLSGKETIYIVPNGPLHLLPWAVLRDSENRYLMQNHRINFLTSARDLIPEPGEQGSSLLPGARSNSETPSGPVLIYNPDFGTFPSAPIKTSSWKNFRFLSGTAVEGEEILGLFREKGYRPSVFEGKNATESSLKSVHAPWILHLATHGFFLGSTRLGTQSGRGLELISFSGGNQSGPGVEDPLLRSGLALADANQGVRGEDGADGIVTALEVLGLDLTGTELVVLSACETGIGGIHQSEGVYGLRRAFLEAGARSVLSTLWRVDDQGTQVFMKRFYAHFLNGVAAGEALRKTRQEFMTDETWSHPYYWAPFTMVGGN